MKHILLIIFLSIILTGCEKKVPCENEVPVVDYRNYYCGNFIFSSYSYTIITMYNYFHYYDTILYEGTILPDMDDDKAIIINYRPENSVGGSCNNTEVYGNQIIILLSKSGNFYYPNLSSLCGGGQSHFYGTFIGMDSLYFDVGLRSIGRSLGQKVSGKRIE